MYSHSHGALRTYECWRLWEFPLCASCTLLEVRTENKTILINCNEMYSGRHTHTQRDSELHGVTVNIWHKITPIQNQCTWKCELKNVLQVKIKISSCRQTLARVDNQLNFIIIFTLGIHTCANMLDLVEMPGPHSQSRTRTYKNLYRKMNQLDCITVESPIIAIKYIQNRNQWTTDRRHEGEKNLHMQNQKNK